MVEYLYPENLIYETYWNLPNKLNTLRHFISTIFSYKLIKFVSSFVPSRENFSFRGVEGASTPFIVPVSAGFNGTFEKIFFCLYK